MVDYDVKIDMDVLEKFLLADCCDELLQVEWLEVGDVLEVAGCECLEGRLQHG